MLRKSGVRKFSIYLKCCEEQLVLFCDSIYFHFESLDTISISHVCRIYDNLLY